VGGSALSGPVSPGSLASQPATAYAISGNALQLRIVSTGRSQLIELSW
jgi:hypothetical protein